MPNICFLYKQVILVPLSVKMSKGKLAVQVAHAAVDAAFNSDKDVLDCWRGEGMKKVVLAVADERELLVFLRLAKKEKLPVALIKDRGLTEIQPGTITALAIGPAREELIDKLTGRLKPL